MENKIIVVRDPITVVYLENSGYVEVDSTHAELVEFTLEEVPNIIYALTTILNAKSKE